MITEKAIYWMAVGLVALAAGNHLISRLDSRCLGQRTMAVVERLSGGPAFAAILDNTSVQCRRAQAAMVRAQVRMAAAQSRFASMQDRFASVQDRMARQESAFARLQAQRDHLMVLQQLQPMRLQIVAPAPNFQLAIPPIPIRTVRLSLNGDNL